MGIVKGGFGGKEGYEAERGRVGFALTGQDGWALKKLCIPGKKDTRYEHLESLTISWKSRSENWPKRGGQKNLRMSCEEGGGPGSRKKKPN